MASMGGSYLNAEPLCRALKGPAFLNKILIAICKADGLPTNGVKAELQTRLATRIRFYALANDSIGFNKLKAMIESPASVMSRSGEYSSSPVAASPHSGHGGYGSSNSTFNMPPLSGHNVYGPPGLIISFKDSPFFRFQSQLGATKPCDTMAQHRHTVDISLRVSDNHLLEKASNDKALRVMIFCAGETGPHKQDVAFPHQSEIKVNGGEVKANLRGLKNKPGSTRPVDITDLLRFRPPTYSNTVSMTYALTTKKFYLSVWVVKATAVEDLVKKIDIEGSKISKESVLREMAAKASDPDIETTSSVLSLKCPLSTLRIDLPCRSIRCRHNQCFDATSYLQLQEQGPTWLCPICNNPAPFESLAIDEYVRDILKQTSRSIDQVTVEPAGVWSTAAKTETPRKPRPSTAFGSDDDDELIEIKDDRVSSLKSSGHNGTPQPYTSATRTPEREASTSSASRRPSTKRPASEIVDLTLSDDDDEPPRPVKKQYHPPNGVYNPLPGSSLKNFDHRPYGYP